MYIKLSFCELIAGAFGMDLGKCLAGYQLSEFPEIVDVLPQGVMPKRLVNVEHHEIDATNYLRGDSNDPFDLAGENHFVLPSQSDNDGYESDSESIDQDLSSNDDMDHEFFKFMKEHDFSFRTYSCYLDCGPLAIKDVRWAINCFNMRHKNKLPMASIESTSYFNLNPLEGNKIVQALDGVLLEARRRHLAKDFYFFCQPVEYLDALPERFKDNLSSFKKMD